jgi:hypothetical protein
VPTFAALAGAPTIELSPPPLQAASSSAAAANKNILTLCISLIL